MLDRTESEENHVNKEGMSLFKLVSVLVHYGSYRHSLKNFLHNLTSLR